MTEKNLNTPAIVPPTEQEEIVKHASVTTFRLGEEHPTPAVMGAEAPPSVALELSASGPFGAY